MEGFQVTEIGEKIYCILDAGNSSFYVVEGEEKAAVMQKDINTESMATFQCLKESKIFFRCIIT